MKHTYDHLHRQPTEAWMSDDLPTRTMTYTYDTAGRMLDISGIAGSGGPRISPAQTPATIGRRG